LGHTRQVATCGTCGWCRHTALGPSCRSRRSCQGMIHSIQRIQIKAKRDLS